MENPIHFSESNLSNIQMLRYGTDTHCIWIFWVPIHVYCIYNSIQLNIPCTYT